jgi:hypothetical protein
MDHESLVVVLSAGGAALGGESLESLGGVSVGWVRVEREGEAACLAARVQHEDSDDEFRGRVRRWGAARGWAVAVAPCGRPC